MDGWYNSWVCAGCCFCGGRCLIRAVSQGAYTPLPLLRRPVKGIWHEDSVTTQSYLQMWIVRSALVFYRLVTRETMPRPPKGRCLRKHSKEQTHALTNERPTKRGRPLAYVALLRIYPQWLSDWNCRVLRPEVARSWDLASARNSATLLETFPKSVLLPVTHMGTGCIQEIIDHIDRGPHWLRISYGVRLPQTCPEAGGSSDSIPREEILNHNDIQ